MRFLILLVAASRFLFSSDADLIAFSYNRPMQLYALLESVEKRVTHFRKLAVICRIDPSYQNGYATVQSRFQNVHFVEQSPSNFKSILMDLLFGEFGQGADYVVFAVDDIIVTDEVDIREGIGKLEQTGANGLYYRLGSHINYFYMLDRPQKVPDLFEVGDRYFGWDLNKAEDEWAYPNTVDFALYPKGSIQSDFNQFDFSNPSELEGYWGTLGCKKQLGLCCNRAKVINIPLNIVSKVGWMNRASHRFSSEDLNLLFSIGLKIDIDQFYRVLNTSVHVDYIPAFIRRF